MFVLWSFRNSISYSSAVQVIGNSWGVKRFEQYLGFIFTNSFFIFGPKYSASNKSKIVLINFLFGKAKMAIWLTRKRKNAI